MCYDQKRSNDIKKKAKTKLSYTFYAYNFYQMKAQGIMERLIPYLDDYQLTMLKIQNFKNRAVPSGWWIDLAALEKIAMTKGGQDMQPQEEAPQDLGRYPQEEGGTAGRPQGEEGETREGQGAGEKDANCRLHS
jgi:hypothetical protein